MEYPLPAPTGAMCGAPPPPPLKQSASSGAPTAHPGELFHFHPRASNPELWRTTVPLVVRLRCGRHKGLVATWTAIHWLIVLYAASGRCAFGMREIAQEAGVGRNELAGSKGLIQRLVDLGLLSIVGYEPVPGVKQARPIYYVDLAELERQSLELVPALLCERQLPPPPRPAPDPRQLALFGAEPHEAGTVPPSLVGAAPAFGQPTHGNGTVGAAPGHGTTHGNGTVAPAYRSRARLLRSSRHGSEPGTHGNGTASAVDAQALASAGASMHGNGTGTCTPQDALALVGASMHETGTGTHENMPDHARNRDVERKNEEKERASENTRAHDFQQIVAATAQTVILVLQQQGIIPTTGAASAQPANLEALPATPAGQPALRASIVALWQGERANVSPREHTQLALLADSYDAATGGFGAYWLGRAIMLADLCLSERGRPLSLTYVRKMLRRWADEGSWGSDLAGEDAGEPARAARQREPRDARAERAAPVGGPALETATAGALPGPASRAVPVTSDTEHPAVAAYRAAFGQAPNEVQAEEIAKTVTDLAVWQQVFHDWKLEGWQAVGVGKMLDRYQKKLSGATPASSEPAPSVRVIHTYPGLDLDQRERWIRKFHAATTPAEKRAVLARLEQEHPR